MYSSMQKYVEVKVQDTVATGTTTVDETGNLELQDGSATFTGGVVNPGDVVHDTSDDRMYTVASVVDANTLSLVVIGATLGTGLDTGKNYIIYSIAKSGLTALTKSLAKELGPEIRVNAVAPGPVLWPDKINEFDEGYRKKVISQTMLKKVGDTDDIAKAVEFLLLNAPFITSHVLNVDGGRSFNSE